MVRKLRHWAGMVKVRKAEWEEFKRDWLVPMINRMVELEAENKRLREQLERQEFGVQHHRPMVAGGYQPAPGAGEHAPPPWQE